MGSGYLGGGPYLPFFSIATNITLTDEHYTMAVTLAGVTVTLPPSNAVAIGRIFIIKAVNLGVGTATIAASGSDTIDGSATTTVTAYTSIVVQSNGAGTWNVIASH